MSGWPGNGFKPSRFCTKRNRDKHNSPIEKQSEVSKDYGTKKEGSVFLKRINK
jgi:hypothetical protein